MTLETGTMLALSPLQTSERGIEKIFLDISNQVARSGFEVDLESKGDDRVEIFVRRPRKFCDSVPPFTIPIIPQTVGRMHKAAVAFGVYLSTNSQPTGAANAATPHR